jgi:hypothetical protein
MKKKIETKVVQFAVCHYSCYQYLDLLFFIYIEYIYFQNFFPYNYYNFRILLLQIEAGLVKKQYIAKVVGEFPENEVFYLALD